MRAETTPLPPAEPPPQRRGGIRPIVGAICGALCVLLLPATVVAVWARATLLDGDAAASVAREALADSEVQNALASKLNELVMESLTLPDDVVGDLPPALDRLRPALRLAVDGLVERTFQRILERPRVPDLVAELVTVARNAAVRLINGDGLVDGVNIADGEVTINLLPLISRGLAELGQLGVPTLDGVPTLNADDDPGEQIAQLEAATGRDLPDDFGQLVIYRSDQVNDASTAVATAQRLVVVATRAFWLLVALSVALPVATIALARDRGVAVLRLAVGAAAAMVLVRAALHRLQSDAPDLAARPAGRSVIEIVLDELLPGLMRTTGLILLVAAVGCLVVTLSRGWRHDDILLLAAVGVGLSVVTILGLASWSVVAGIATALIVVPIERRLGSQRVLAR